MRRFLLSSALIALALSPAPAPRPAQAQWAVACVNCATVYNQLLEYAKQAQMAAEAIQIRVNSVQQTYYMAQNALTYPQMVWAQIEGNYRAIQSIFDQGTHLTARAGMAASSLSTFGSLSRQVLDMPTMYEQWGRQANSNIASTLAGIGLQNQQAVTQQAVLRAAMAQAQGARGQMQAMQAANALAAAQAAELHGLAQTMRQHAVLVANEQYRLSQEQAAGQVAQHQLMTMNRQPDTGNRRY